MTANPVDPAENAAALFEAGKKFYFSGRDSAADPKLALAYFQKAAALGFAPAQRLLGICLLEGQIAPQDLSAARLWLEKAASQDDPQAAFSLAKMAAIGLDGPKDWQKAYQLLKRPAVFALPESRALAIRLKEELRSLYPNLLTALNKEEEAIRAELPPRRGRFVPPFLAPGREALDVEEFEILLALNLGRIAPENALLALKKCLIQYYATFKPA
jgi:hypothetical protein